MAELPAGVVCGGATHWAGKDRPDSIGPHPKNCTTTLRYVGVGTCNTPTH